MKFGEFIKELRVKRGYTLNKLCKENNYDSGNHSKLERNVMAPPQVENNLRTLAHALGLSEKTEDWYKFFDLAIVVGNGKIPGYVMKNEEVLNRLPLLLRTISSKRINTERLDKLIDLIREN